MVYKAFSDQKNIEKMVRNIEVWPEQETLEVTLFQNKETPYWNFNHWVKYVSTGSPNKLQVYLYWDTKIEDAFLARIEKRLLQENRYFYSLSRRFLVYYRRFDFFTRQLKERPTHHYRTASEKELIKTFKTFTSYSRSALVGYYVVYDITNLLLRVVKRELQELLPDSEKLFEELCTIGVHSNIGKKSSKKEKEQVLKLLKPLKRYPNLYIHTIWLRRMMGYRNNETTALDDYYKQAGKFFREVSRRFGISFGDFWYLSKEEIIGGLQKKVNIKEIIAERKREGFTIKQVGRKIKVLTGVKPEDWHETISHTTTKEVTGNPAFLGKVTGRVQIVFNPVSTKIKKGDILVTPMTTPDFVPLMKNAAAIVTDEGGLLCHAAIVARELKKPCIIGTKIATRVFKDGDIVEVDANRGTVRIIEKREIITHMSEEWPKTKVEKPMPKVILHFMRHSTKEENPEKRDRNLQITSEGRELAAKKFEKPLDMRFSHVKGSSRIRAQETAAIAATQNPETNPEDLGAGKMRVRKELDVVTGDSSSKMAANVAEIIYRNFEVASRGALILEKRKNSEDEYHDFERILVTHAGSQESFLLKVVEKMRGVTAHDELFSVIGEDAFGLTEGFDAVLSKEDGEEQIRVTYKKGDYVFDEIIPTTVIKEIMEEGKQD